MSINIYFQNVRGLRSKLLVVRNNILAENYGVIILVETWLQNDIYNREVMDDRYNIYRKDRNLQRSAGDFNIPSITGTSTDLGMHSKSKIIQELLLLQQLKSYNNCTNEDGKTLDLILCDLVLEVCEESYPLVNLDKKHPALNIAIKNIKHNNQQPNVNNDLEGRWNFKNASKSPVKYRLNLLLSCIYFEDKQLYRKLNVLPPDNPKYDTTLELNRRPVLRKIFKCLQRTIAIQNDINKYELGFQVPDLKVAGITGYRKSIYKAIHIEVLDEYTTLKNTDHLPTGLMQLKLRLLEKQEEGLIVIQAYEVEPLTDEELHSFLLDEINFVC